MPACERQIFYDEPFIVPLEEEPVHAKRRRLVRKSQELGLGAIGRYHANYNLLILSPKPQRWAYYSVCP